MHGKKIRYRSPVKYPIDNYLPNKDYYMNVRSSDSQKTQK